MSLSEEIRTMLAARATTDPDAARLLESFSNAHETLSGRSLESPYEREIRAFTLGTGIVSE
jgi:hypothetical protein